MAVFITGGHGHLGSWTAYYLAKVGEECILFDVNHQAPDCLSDVTDKITFIKGDVLDFARLGEIFEHYGSVIDGIIHTVGIMGELVQLDPHHNVILNVAGTVNILEIARLFGIPKIVYTSTGAVYKPTPGIVDEDAEVQPSDLYGSTKISSEYIGQQYANTFDLDFRIARVYFVYGPGKLPSTFVRLYQMAFGALEGLDDLSMDQGADQRLDFTYIEDAARGLALIYQAEDLTNNNFNIATGVPHSILEVVELVQKHSKFNIEVDMGPSVLMERAEALDISRASRDLGFEPQVGLEEGIKKYADWIKNIL